MSSTNLTHSILKDMDAGESPLSLNRARHDPRLQIDGRSRDASWTQRAATVGVRGAGGKRVVLETIVQSGVKVTTPSAIARFVEQQANPTQEPSEA